MNGIPLTDVPAELEELLEEKYQHGLRVSRAYADGSLIVDLEKKWLELGRQYNSLAETYNALVAEHQKVVEELEDMDSGRKSPLFIDLSRATRPEEI